MLKINTKLAKIMSKVLCKNRKPVAVVTEYVRNLIIPLFLCYYCVRGQFDSHIYIFKMSCTNTVYIYVVYVCVTLDHKTSHEGTFLSN